VYEALAHRRAATRSYVLVHVPAAEEHERASGIAQLAEVARSHHIGVVIAGDPADYQTWDEREVAPRVEPDPESLNAFMAMQLSPQVARPDRSRAALTGTTAGTP
jgi:hypothetical protein